MKCIKLIFACYHRNKISSVILLLIFTSAMLIANFAVGQYRYLTYTQDMLHNSNLSNSVYFMPTGFGVDSVGQTPSVFNGKVQKVHATIKKFAAVDSILTSPWEDSCSIGNTYGGYMLYNDQLLKAFHLRITSGKTLDSSSNSDINSKDGVDAVLCGYMFHNIKINEVFPITLTKVVNGKTEKRRVIKVHTIGKMDDPAYTVDFGIGGTQIDADQFFSNGSVIIFRETSGLLSYLQENGSPVILENSFIKFKPNSSNKDKASCLDYLRKNGSINTYSQINDSTEALITHRLKTNMPMPLFFLFVSTISLISVSVLFVYKNLSQFSIYFLCGCNRRKGFRYIAIAIGLISFLAGLINVIIMKNIDFFNWYRIIVVNNMIVDNKTIWLIIVYTLAILLLSIGIPYTVYKKYTPLKMLRGIE